MDPNFEAGVDTTNIELYGVNYEGYVWANVSQLSLFGLSGREIQPSPEEKDNEGLDIVPMFFAIPELTFFKMLYLSAGVEQLISIPNIPGIHELVVENPQDINLMLYLSKIKSLPSDVPDAPYQVYSYFELLFTKFKTNQKVNPVTQINFMVPKDWSVDKDMITLMHYENGWNPVNTEVIGEDGDNYYLRAEVNSYSIFAIVQSPPEEVIQPQKDLHAAQETDIPPTSLPATKNQQFELILSIIALLIGLGVVSYLLKKKRT
jgi:PGF-pre-PGF domain-containing protein